MPGKYIGGTFVSRFAVLILLAVLVFTAAHYSSVAAAEEQGPADVIKGFNAALLESMKGRDLGYSGRYKLLEPVFKESFAVPFMASASVGSYWKTLKVKERQTFLDTYTEWSIAQYAHNFNEFSGERFEIASESKPEQGAVTVVSKLIQPNDEHVDFHYRLRKIDALWRIVDIHIYGVSQLALTRVQFVSVIKMKGFDALIAMLREKINHFSQVGQK